MKTRKAFLVVLAGIAVAWISTPPLHASGELIITEFMAVNQKTLMDEDQDYPDWLEIFNTTNQSIPLNGWGLTDKQGTVKWLFPDMSLPARRFLIVYASGKHRFDPAKPLHTNFLINDVGSYLGLIAPDGKTVISEYGPGYTQQVADVSYGVVMEESASVILDAGSAVKYMVPADGSLGNTWLEKSFDDSAWSAGTLGIGYDAKTVPTYKELIATDIEAQMKAVNTTVYVRIPFTVENPSRLSSLTLRVKYEDGYVAYLNGREVARKGITGTPAWNSKASATRPSKSALEFEDISISAHLDKLEPGENVLAIQGLNENRTGLAFLLLPRLEAAEVTRVDPTQKKYFPSSTQGRANGPGLDGIAQEPVLSVIPGAYDAEFNLEISVDSPQAVIHYTVDRTQPTENSPVYAGPILINKNTVVRARTFEPGLQPSLMVLGTYLILDQTVKAMSSNLPLLVITTFGQAIPEDPLVPSFLTAFYPAADTGRAALLGPSDFDGKIGIKMRGSSSLGFPKKQYRIETWDADSREMEVNILGFPKESDWILYAPYTDKTLMRDVLSYQWSNDIGRYAPRTKFVEVYLVQSGTKVTAAHYNGVYAWIEKIKWGKDRVDIDRIYPSQNEEPDVTGGYILKKDRLDPGESGFVTSRGQNLCYVNPPERETPPNERAPITAAQKVYIKKYIDQFETALYGTNFKDPEKGYAPFIDVDSFIDHHILVEITKNIDGYRLSTFLYKDRGGKLVMGPIWDYNLTLGNANYLDGWLPTGWYYNLVGDGDYPFYRRIQQDPAFLQRYKERWFEFRKGPFATKKLLEDIDRYVDLLKEAEPRDHKKWPILGTYIWPNWFIGKTYLEEINFMKDWLTKRVAWMDSQFIVAPTFSQKGGNVPVGFQLTITVPIGEILYTVDKTDPRNADESRSPTALDYTGPVVIEKNTRVRARANVGNVWSGITEATFVTAIPPLVVTEIMYQPAPPSPGSAFTAADDFEYLEIQNIGETDFDLTGVQVTDGVKFNFTGSAVTSLPPGGHAVVARKRAAFIERYGSDGRNIAGEYTGILSNTRATIGLKGALDEQIQKFIYDSSWYAETKGIGRSLVAVDPKGSKDLWSKKEGWRPSSYDGGSPGAEDPPPPPKGFQVPGDLTQDSKLSISDAIQLIAVVLGGQVPLPCEGTISSAGNLGLLDLNADGQVLLGDAIHLLVYLFQNGPTPARGARCVETPGCPDRCTP